MTNKNTCCNIKTSKEKRKKSTKEREVQTTKNIK